MTPNIPKYLRQTCITFFGRHYATQLECKKNVSFNGQEIMKVFTNSKNINSLLFSNESSEHSKESKMKYLKSSSEQFSPRPQYKKVIEKTLNNQGLCIQERTKWERDIYPPRKRLMMSLCQEILSHQTMLIFQVNSLTSKESTLLRNKLKNSNLELKFISPNIFKVLCRQHFDTFPFVSIVYGPTMIAYSNQHPNKLQQALSVLNKEEKLILIAGRIDNVNLSPEGVQSVINNLPTKEALQAQLVSFLEPYPYHLIRSIESPLKHLASALDQVNQKLIAQP